MMLASAAQAQVCLALQNAVTYEADLIDTDEGHRPFDIRTLAALRLNARRLHDYYVPDPLLAQAVTAYIDSVTKLVTHPAGHADPLHRSHVYHLILASNVPCAGQITPRPDVTAPKTTPVFMDRLRTPPTFGPRHTMQIAALLLATALCTLCIIFIVYRRKQVRGVCHDRDADV